MTNARLVNSLVSPSIPNRHCYTAHIHHILYSAEHHALFQKQRDALARPCLQPSRFPSDADQQSGSIVPPLQLSIPGPTTCR